jgi:hypothetical protein
MHVSPSSRRRIASFPAFGHPVENFTQAGMGVAADRR